MASQYDIQPGVSESVSNQDIGSYALNQWQHIKLDGNFPFLMSDITLKTGTTTIPSSAYELAQDDNATAQEVGLTGDTLIGMIRIVNVSYSGITLNITGNNFGTYVSNQGVIDHVAERIATRTAPIGSNIADGEPALFSSTSGLAIKSGNVAGLSLWDSGTTYSTAGTIARIEGSTYAATGLAGNLNKDPRLQVNAPYWFTTPDDKTLEYMCKNGISMRAGMHGIHNRAGANYQQYMRIGSRSYSGTTYDFYAIHLDGTTVTGNTTLENLLDVGGLAEYPYLDLYAPEVLSVRTLLDAGGRTFRAQSSGGKADTIGEVQEDAMQRVTGTFNNLWLNGDVDGAFSRTLLTSTRANASSNDGNYTVSFDSANSTSPNTAKTDDDETRMANIVEGCAYIIVMVAA